MAIYDNLGRDMRFSNIVWKNPRPDLRIGGKNCDGDGKAALVLAEIESGDRFPE